jgi:hypothetical protein
VAASVSGRRREVRIFVEEEMGNMKSQLAAVMERTKEPELVKHRSEVGLSPWLTQTVKTLFAVC